VALTDRYLLGLIFYKDILWGHSLNMFDKNAMISASHYGSLPFILNPSCQQATHISQTHKAVSKYSVRNIQVASQSDFFLLGGK
jgi:hypothetical protein